LIHRDKRGGRSGVFKVVARLAVRLEGIKRTRG
jgi:hypothetical protein